MSPVIRPLRSLANGFGLAWWARVETTAPDVIYWFGPFLTRRGLKTELESFLEDIRSESPASVDHEILRTRRGEPLTIEGQG